MIYPTNEQMPEQLAPPSFRERLVSWLRVRLGIVDDRTKAITANGEILEILGAQNKAMREMQARVESLEKLAIETNRIVQFHHQVLNRWAVQSATLRDIEDVHAKKLKREADALAKQQASAETLASAKERLGIADAFDGEDGG